MFNVFIPLHFKLIEAFRKKKNRYLVCQTNRYAIDLTSEEAKDPILVSDYDDIVTAKTHLNAIIGNDKYKCILDLENETHRNKLLEMIKPDSKYKVYSNYIMNMEDVRRRLMEKYKPNIKSYIYRRTNWRLSRDETIYPNLELVFGEFFVVMKYGSQTERIKLSELEKY